MAAGAGTVLLDLDGVLLDHAAASRAAVHGWLGERATAEVVDAWYVAQDLHLAAWRAGTKTWEAQRRDRLRDVLPLIGEPVGSDDELDALFVAGYGAAYRRAWTGFADARPALEALHGLGVATAVLTNGAEDQSLLARPPRRFASRRNRRAGAQRAKLAALGLLELVGPVFTAGALGLRKPDPRAFLESCVRLGVAPSSVLYVGDEHEIDVLGARGAGLRAVLLDRFGTAPPDEPAVIRTLTDLLPLVAR